MSPLPITVVGGYLGAGKTTLINHLLRHASGQRLAILVNEFGELAIDEDLIEAEDDNLISISGGCICCSFGDNLIATVTELAKLEPRPDHIVIEASGVAIPSSIAASLSLLQGFTLNGVIVLADCTTAKRLTTDDYVGDTILRQLQDADLVIATKSDLASPADTDLVCKRLESIADGARVVAAQQGRVPLNVVLGPVGVGHDYVSSPHSDRLFESQVFELEGSVNVSRLARALVNRDTGLVRAKGFVQDETGRSFLIQLVGQRANVTEVKSADRHAVVCIAVAGQLDREKLEKMLTTTCRKSQIEAS